MLKTDASDNYVGSLHIWKAIWEIREAVVPPCSNLLSAEQQVRVDIAECEMLLSLAWVEWNSCFLPHKQQIFPRPPKFGGVPSDWKWGRGKKTVLTSRKESLTSSLETFEVNSWLWRCSRIYERGERKERKQFEQSSINKCFYSYFFLSGDLDESKKTWLIGINHTVYKLESCLLLRSQQLR